MCAATYPITATHDFSPRSSPPDDPLNRPISAICDTQATLTVNLTRIYTKLGDAGETHLGDMRRVSKLNPRVEAYGTIDELNATVGLSLLAPGIPHRISEWLKRIQNDLLDLGADLSVPPAPQERQPAEQQPPDGQHPPDEQQPAQQRQQKPARSRLRIEPHYVQWLEQACDEVNANLQPLRSFVIPGGTEASARLHICRTVCRRAERRTLAVQDVNPQVLRYLNRLSDLFFILARAANEGAGSGPQALWEPGAHQAHDAPPSR